MSGIFRPSSGGGGGSSTPSNTLVRIYTPGVVLYDAVYQTGVSNTVDRASAVSTATTPVLGIVTAIDTPAVGQCYVQYDGDVMGFTGLTVGEVYMLSKQPGKLLWEGDTGNSNYPSVHGNVVQAVGIAMSASTLSVAIQDQEEL